MERRDAIKSIGLGSAALFTSSLFLGTLQSCSSAPTVNWIPVFLTPEEAAQLEKVCEAIIPKDDLPGAIDAGVPAHIDETLKVLREAEESDHIRKGMAAFVKNFNATQDVSFNKATTPQLTDYINGMFKGFEENPDKMEEMWKTMRAEGEKPEEVLEVFFINNITDATTSSYYTSELVGETVMRYDPIPVKYEGCIPYEKGQKAWSSV